MILQPPPSRVLSFIRQGEVVVESATALVDEMMYVGCGQCVQTCPSKSITLRHFTDRQLIAEMLEAMNVMADKQHPIEMEYASLQVST